MENRHITDAINSLKAARNDRLSEVEALEQQIHSLSQFVGETPAESKPAALAQTIPIAPQSIPHKKKKKPQSTKQRPTYDRYNPQTEIGRKIHDLMTDGVVRSTAAIRQLVDPENKATKEIHSSINYMVKSGILETYGRGVYRRTGRAYTPRNPLPYGNYPSRKLALLDIMPVDQEVGTNDMYDLVKDIEHEREPNASEVQLKSRISAQLANLEAAGKLIRVRPGIYTMNKSLAAHQ